MMAATSAKLGSVAEAGGSKAQLAPILAFCSKMTGITRSAHTDGALNTGLGGQTGLNDRIFANNLIGGFSNGKCQVSYA